jgi:hypothetical protein
MQWCTGSPQTPAAGGGAGWSPHGGPCTPTRGSRPRTFCCGSRAHNAGTGEGGDAAAHLLLERCGAYLGRRQHRHPLNVEVPAPGEGCVVVGDAVPLPPAPHSILQPEVLAVPLRGCRMVDVQTRPRNVCLRPWRRRKAAGKVRLRRWSERPSSPATARPRPAQASLVLVLRLHQP